MDNKIMQKILARYITYYEKEVHSINHMLKVYSFARNIAVQEGIEGNLLDIIEASSILHDIGIKESIRKYNSGAGNYQEMEGPPIARQWLEELQLDKYFIDRVCYLIGHHHSYSYIDNIDFQILVEADFLVNIYESNMGKDKIEAIREKYFKTKAGTAILDSIY
jgi:HD superfamily phosphodiesterase